MSGIAPAQRTSPSYSRTRTISESEVKSATDENEIGGPPPAAATSRQQSQEIPPTLIEEEVKFEASKQDQESVNAGNTEGEANAAQADIQEASPEGAEAVAEVDGEEGSGDNAKDQKTIQLPPVKTLKSKTWKAPKPPPKKASSRPQPNSNLFAIWGTSARCRTPNSMGAPEHNPVTKVCEVHAVKAGRMDAGASMKAALGNCVPRAPRCPGALDGLWVSKIDGEVRGKILGTDLVWMDGDRSMISWHGATAISIIVDGDTHTGVVTQGRIKWGDGDIWIRPEGLSNLHGSTLGSQESSLHSSVEFRNWETCAWTPRAPLRRGKQKDDGVMAAAAQAPMLATILL